MSDFYGVLINELRTDPLGFGYANMTDDEVRQTTNRGNQWQRY